MRILVKPSDLVKRCMWDYFTYYIVGSEKESQRLLLEDLEFEISERDALIIGLVKVVETDNLIHRFNDYFVHFLNTKSIKSEGAMVIKKKSIEISIDRFLEKFPDYWQAPKNYLSSLEKLVIYIGNLREMIEKVPEQKAVSQGITYEVYPTTSVKKLLAFNYN